MKRMLAHLFLSAVMALMVGCGGGGTNGGGTTPTPPVTPPPVTPPQPAITISPSRLPDAVLGKVYSASLTASGGTAPYTWAATSGLPEGTQLSADGKLSGTLSSATNSSIFQTIFVKVTDSSNPPATATTSVRLTGYPQIQIAPYTSLSDANANIPYQGRLWISGGSGAYTTTIGGATPLGITVSPSGSLVEFGGTATTPGQYPLTINVKDSADPPQTVALPITLNVMSKLAISSASLPYGVVGRPFTGQIQAVNGVGGLTFTALELPQGLQIDNSGTISGVPTKVSSSFGIRVTDSNNPPQVAERWFYSPIYGTLALNPTSPYTLHVGDQVNEWFAPSGGVPPLSWSVSAGSLPPGTWISAWERLAGSPTSAGTYVAGIEVRDSANPPQVANAAVTFNVLPPSVSTTYQTLATAVLGRAYTEHLYATRGTFPYTWAIQSGSLPPGLTIDSLGVISGTPTSAGSFTFDAVVTDSATPAQVASGNYSILVDAVPLRRNDTIATASSTDSTSVTGSISPYSDPVDTANPDTDYYKFVANVGDTVEIGVSASGGSPGFDPVLEIVDANGQRFRTCKDPGDDNPPSPAVKDATPDAFDDECLNDDVQIGVYTNSRLSFLVPGTAGTQVTFYAHVLDSRGDARPDFKYWMTISGVQPSLRLSKTLPEAVVGKPYDTGQLAYGGTGVITVSFSGGTLPPGLSVSSGTIKGTPTTAGQYQFSLTASDSATPPQTVTQNYNVTVTSPVTLVTSSLPPAQTGVSYFAPITCSGGVPPYRFGMMSNNWTPGLDFNTSSGIISGAPLYTGSFVATISCVDSSFANRAYGTVSIDISPGPLVLKSTQLPTAYKGWGYQTSLKVLGGKRDYTFAVQGGNFPAGLTLNPNSGGIAGTVSAAGTYVFTVKVTDALSTSTTTDVTLTVTDLQ